MPYSELDSVVLETDIPEHDLKRGDIGAVVHVYSPESIEVEFVRASGVTQALLTLNTSQLRPVGPRDQLSVRPLDAA